MAYFFRYISLFTLFNLFNPATSAGKIEFEVYGGPLARIFADCLRLCCKKIALPHGYTLKYLQKHPADNYNIEQYPLKQVTHWNVSEAMKHAQWYFLNHVL